MVEGLSIADIAIQTFSSTSTVHKYLSRYNLPLRSTDTKTRSRLRYGESLKNGRVCGERKELRTIAKMQDLRDRRFSYWKIADVFNSMKIPTKTGRGKWHARYIQKLLEEGHMVDVTGAAF